MRAARALRWVACALASATLIRLSFPPFDAGPLILLAWAPLLWAVTSVSWGTALGVGFFHGLVLGLSSHHWVVSAIVRNSDLSTFQGALALLAIAALCGLRSAAVSVAVSLSARRGVPLYLSFPVFLGCAELLIPGFFPWTNALAVHTIPIWSQAAAWGGATLVSVWLSTSNALLVESAARGVRSRRASAAIAPLLGAIGVVAFMTLFGAWSVAAQDSRVAEAPRRQLAIAHAVSLDSRQGELIPTLRALSIDHQERFGVPDVVLWPEGVTPLPVPTARVTETARSYWLRDRQQPPGAPQLRSRLLLGVPVDEPDGLRNAAVLVERGGRYLGAYAKQYLVPIGETGLLPDGGSGRALEQGVTAFRSAPSQTTLALDAHPVTVTICFEDILSEAVRDEVVRTQGELLVNLTSDRWFAGTSAVPFHFALSKLRAVEHRKYLIRSTVDGVSGMVDSSGRVVVSAVGGPSRILPVEVPMLAGLTLYAEWQPWIRGAWLALGSLLGVHALRRRATRRHTG